MMDEDDGVMFIRPGQLEMPEGLDDGSWKTARQVHVCANGFCGKVIAPGQRMRYGAPEGGYVCQACGNGAVLVTSNPDMDRDYMDKLRRAFEREVYRPGARPVPMAGSYGLPQWAPSPWLTVQERPRRPLARWLYTLARRVNGQP